MTKKYNLTFEEMLDNIVYTNILKKERIENEIRRCVRKMRRYKYDNLGIKYFGRLQGVLSTLEMVGEIDKISALNIEGFAEDLLYSE